MQCHHPKRDLERWIVEGVTHDPLPRIANIEGRISSLVFRGALVGLRAQRSRKISSRDFPQAAPIQEINNAIFLHCPALPWHCWRSTLICPRDKPRDIRQAPAPAAFRVKSVQLPQETDEAIFAAAVRRCPSKAGNHTANGKEIDHAIFGNAPRSNGSERERRAKGQEIDHPIFASPSAAGPVQQMTTPLKPKR